MLVELCVPCTYQGAKQRLAKQGVLNYFKERLCDENTNRYV